MRAVNRNFAGGDPRFSPTPRARSCWNSRSRLPLLVVFVVGIFDFGGAFDLKQKLNNIAREGARFASSLPTTDLDAIGTPPSITAIRDLVVSHLQAARLNDCGLARQAGAGPAATYVDLHCGGRRLPGAPGSDDRTKLCFHDGLSGPTHLT